MLDFFSELERNGLAVGSSIRNHALRRFGCIIRHLSPILFGRMRPRFVYGSRWRCLSRFPIGHRHFEKYQRTKMGKGALVGVFDFIHRLNLDLYRFEYYVQLWRRSFDFDEMRSSS
jgi:hypothetical protein